LNALPTMRSRDQSLAYGALEPLGRKRRCTAVPFSAWFTVKVSPAMVRNADRAPLVLSATEYWTIPDPEPLVPDVMVSQDGALDVAVHEHPEWVAVTETDPCPMPPEKDAEVGLIE